MFLQKNFIFLKEKLNLSYRQIEAATGIHTRTLVILANKNDENMRIISVNKLASYLQVSIDDLVNKDLTIDQEKMSQSLGHDKNKRSEENAF